MSYDKTLAHVALHVLGDVLDQCSTELHDVVIEAIEKANGNTDEARKNLLVGLRTLARTLADESTPITETELSGTLIVLAAALTLHRAEVHLQPIKHHTQPSQN